MMPHPARRENATAAGERAAAFAERRIEALRQAGEPFVQADKGQCLTQHRFIGAVLRHAQVVSEARGKKPGVLAHPADLFPPLGEIEY